MSGNPAAACSNCGTLVAPTHTSMPSEGDVELEDVDDPLNKAIRSLESEPQTDETRRALITLYEHDAALERRTELLMKGGRKTADRFLAGEREADLEAMQRLVDSLPD